MYIILYDYFIKISRHELAIYTYIILNIIMYVHIYSIDPWTWLNTHIYMWISNTCMPGKIIDFRLKC